MSRYQTYKNILTELDVSLGIFNRPEEETISKKEVVSLVNEIKAEMDEEWNDLNPDAKLLRNFVRGRITTCEDILNRLR